MPKLTEEQVMAVMLNITMKEAQLLVIQALDLVHSLQQKKFHQALTNHEPILERVQFLRGLLMRAGNSTSKPN